MHKRTLAVLALAAAARWLLPFGLPTSRSTPRRRHTTASSIEPLPLEQAGTLSPGERHASQLCVQPH